MKKGHSHDKASPLCDKIVFDKVMALLFLPLPIQNLNHTIVIAIKLLTASKSLWFFSSAGKTRFRRTCTAYSIWSSTSCYPCRSFPAGGLMCSCFARIWYAHGLIQSAPLTVEEQIMTIYTRTNNDSLCQNEWLS